MGAPAPVAVSRFLQWVGDVVNYRLVKLASRLWTAAYAYGCWLSDAQESS